MPMKRKDIPALLATRQATRAAPCRRRNLIDPPLLLRLTPPKSGGNFLPEPAVHVFQRNGVQGLPLPVARPQKLFRQAGGATSVLKGVQSHPSLARGSGGAGAFLRVGAVGGQHRWSANR
jgi:hypothetical protein